MSDSYLLDTGIANRLILGDPTVIQHASLAIKLYVPDIVLGELYYGACYHAYLHHSTKLLDRYDLLYRTIQHDILHCDAETATYYGLLYAQLRSHGQIIQQNDCWIAALALQLNLTIATMDSDFQRIPRLKMELWS